MVFDGDCMVFWLMVQNDWKNDMMWHVMVLVLVSIYVLALAIANWQVFFICICIGNWELAIGIVLIRSWYWFWHSMFRVLRSRKCWLIPFPYTHQNFSIDTVNPFKCFYFSVYIYIFPSSQRPRKTWSFKSEVKDHTLLLKT